MLKFGEKICKHKKLIILLVLILLIPAVLGIKATKINYDILVYLPDNIETIKGANILSDDFDMGAFSIIVLDNNMKTKDINKLEEKVKKVNTVQEVVSVVDGLGTNIPESAIPQNIKDKVYKDGSTVMLVTFKDGISSDTTMNAVKEIKDITDENCKVSGMSSVLLDTKDLSNKEVAIYVVIAVALCLIVLELALDSYIVPLLLLGNIGIAILFNLGTNIVLGQISYITKAISAVLQLGVTTDFSIFLYHSYMREKKTSKTIDEAMSKAISSTASSVFGSSLTTIAGFLALCSMNLTLGKDIGIVMAKGVLLGVISVITVLPAMLLVFNKVAEKTKHKEILPKFTHTKNFILKHNKLIILLFIIILPFAVYGYKGTKVYYNLNKSLPDTLESVAGNNELRDKFGVVSTELILVDKDLPDYKVNQMLDEIDSLDGMDWTLSYSKVSKNIPEEILSKDIKKIFKSDKYKMIIVNSKYELASDELNNQIGEINNIIKKYDENGMLAGEGPLTKDLIEVSNHDFNSVNIVSIAIIFILMLFVLKSIALPIILIIVIEFAIFINMGIPFYMGNVIPFIASIVIGTIQLGATIDYAILITTKYIELRKQGKDKTKAIDEALGTSISSVVVSALCFFGATFGVGVYSKIELIGSLCSLMARGAIISMVVVLTCLPAFLTLFDKLICKTTVGMKNLKN